MSLLPGTEVGHYRIIEKIGAGGMGEVYLAEDMKLKRRVALKFLPVQYAADSDFKARFVREAEAAAKLNHPNIITIHEVSEYRGRPFFAMEHVEGLSLKDYIAAQKLSFDEIVALAIAICEGLREAHGAGVVHRDIKPANILMDKGNRPKLLDFGLATVAGNEHLTRTGSTLGTVGYMSPEQVEGKNVDERSDLFSLGVVLYELIAGRSPFKRESDAATLKAIASENPEPLARYKADVPEELQRTVGKLLEKDPSMRYQSAVGVISDLKRLIAPAQSSIALSATGQSRRRLMWAGLGIVAIAAVLVWQFFRPAEQAATGDARKLLAVLPFENLGDPADEYFADGITEEITARLAGIPNLGVIARTSVTQYKGTQKTIPQIGRELGVDYILEGTIRWQKTTDATDRVRVTPQLIRVSDATHVWADIYDEVLTGVFQVQGDVAGKVVSALDLSLTEPGQRLLEAGPTKNLQAFDYYLRGNEQYNKGFTIKKYMQLAAHFYEEAVKSDPGFALAYTKLSRAYTELYWHQEMQQEDLDKAIEAVEKAKELNPDLPHVHLAMGTYHYHAGDFDLALDEFARAQEALPNNSDLLAEIAYVRRRQGNCEAAIPFLEEAVKLDPQAVSKIMILADTYTRLRKFSLAEPIFDRAISLAPELYYPWVNKAMMYLVRDGDVESAQHALQDASRLTGRLLIDNLAALIELCAGNYDAALEKLIDDPAIPGEKLYLQALVYELMGEKQAAHLRYDSTRMVLERGVASHPDDGRYHSGLSLAYAGLGRKDEAIREAELASRLAPLSRDILFNFEATLNVARTYLKVGEYDAAIDKLDEILAAQTWITAPFLRINPIWAPLYDHPRFQALLDKYEKEHDI